MRYVIAELDGQDVGGIGGPAEPTGSPSGVWSTYVAVDDIDATIASVEAAGGRVVAPVEQAGEGGHNATVADPFGVEISLWQARRRLGAQVTNTPGAWNFSDLHAADPAASQAFYEQVFGWVFVDMGFATMIQVPGYGDHLAATVDPGIHERQADGTSGVRRRDRRRHRGGRRDTALARHVHGGRPRRVGAPGRVARCHRARPRGHRLDQAGDAA